MDNQKPTVKNAQKFIIEPGKIYGDYKVLESVIIQGRKSRETRWKCVNIYTGEEKLKKGCDIACFLTGEEQKEYNDKLVMNDEHQMGFRHYLYLTYRRGAHARDINFEIPFDHFNKLIQQKCFYCGEDPHPIPDNLKHRSNIKQPDFYYNGIDRLDSNLGYTIDNCVPCCKKCNYMKHISSEKEFYDHISKIYKYKHLDQGSTTIENALLDNNESE